MNDVFHKQKTLVDITYAEPVKIPSHIGPYKIESLLDKGGMSLLYLGVHPQTKEPLVLKVLSPEFSSYKEMVSRFLKEAKIIGMTSHPNIVKLYGQGKWEKGIYIAMEFIRGVSLRQFIAQQSLSLKRSIDIILQVAYALYHLHSHKVIHGDLKPENILITEEGGVKVIDFGIAHLLEETKHSETKAIKIAGTPNYMSPEQKESPSKISFASDIYSLGVIAYELAMGKLSFGVIHLSLVPKGLRKIIEKMIAVSIEERYQNVLSLITDLSQYLKSGGLEKDRPGTDQFKETLESLQLTITSLSPSVIPPWPPIEAGIAKYKTPNQFDSYFDVFRFPNHSLGMFIVQTPENNIENCVSIGFFRGILRSLLAQKGDLLTKPQQLTSLLNQLLVQDPLQQKFYFSCLVLNSMKDELSFISCETGSLLHLLQGSDMPKKLSNQNPLLGQDPNAEFFEIKDNWAIGDILLFHSLDPSLDPLLLEAFKENNLLSAQAQAEAVFKKGAAHPSFALQKNSKMLVSIQRIG